MLFLVHFPFADLRSFVPEVGHLLQDRPDWTLPPDPRRPEFLRGLGPLRKRSSFRENDHVIWPGEGWYATARRGIRLPQSITDLFSDPRLTVTPHHIVRRIYSNGRESWRVDMGFGCVINDDLSLRDVVTMCRTMLKIPVRVRAGERLHQRRGSFGPPLPLLQQQEAIADLLARATQAQVETADAANVRGFICGRPMVIVECNEHDRPLDIEIQDVDRRHIRHFSHGDPMELEGLGLTARIAGQEIPVVILKTSLPSDDPDVWGYRVALGRIHAEREILTSVLRALGREEIPETPALERYFSRIHSDFFSERRFGVSQSNVRAAIATYETLTPSETLALNDKLLSRRQSRNRVSELVTQLRPNAGPILIAEAGSVLTMNSSYIGGNVIGSQVAVGSSFQNASVVIGKAADAQVKQPLEDLLKLTQSLVAQLQDDAAKQAVANKMEALAKEATSLKPDHSMLKVTGQGLIDAAKFVADLGGPIVKAVGVVLGLFGIVL